MSLRKIPIFQYKEMPPGSRVCAVYLEKKKFFASSAMMVLRKVCEALIASNKLTARNVRGFGFSWLAIRPGMMRLPTLITDGIYLSESGDDNTMYLRLTLVLKRLLIPQDKCMLEYEADEEPKPASEEKEETRGHFVLKEWDESDEEPSVSVQKRINELRPGDFKMLVPYKLGIVNKKYRTESWSDFVNTFAAYVFLFLKNGPSLLWDIQSSVHWKHPMMVRRDGDRITPLPLTSDIDGAKACWMMGDLVNALQFDRYSISINCCPVGKLPVKGADKTAHLVEQDLLDGLLDPIESRECDPVRLEEEKNDPGMSHSIDVVLGRHLRPAFWIKSD